MPDEEQKQPPQFAVLTLRVYGGPVDAAQVVERLAAEAVATEAFQVETVNYNITPDHGEWDSPFRPGAPGA